MKDVFLEFLIAILKEPAVKLFISDSRGVKPKILSSTNSCKVINFGILVSKRFLKTLILKYVQVSYSKNQTLTLEPWDINWMSSFITQIKQVNWIYIYNAN